MRARARARGDRTILLTHYHHVAEDLIVGHVGTVPTVMSELVPALAQTQCGALAHRRHGVRRFSALLALAFRQSGNTAADGRADHHCPDHPETEGSGLKLCERIAI